MNKIAFPSGNSSFLTFLTASIHTSLKISIPAGTIPAFNISDAAFPASLTPAKETTNAEECAGIGLILSVISVITPRVPSDPTKRSFREYPVELFEERDPVSVICPSGITNSNFKT